MAFDSQDGILMKHISRFAGVLGDDFPRLLHLLGRAVESLNDRKTLVLPVEDLEALRRALEPERINGILAVVTALKAELEAKES